MVSKPAGGTRVPHSFAVGSYKGASLPGCVKIARDNMGWRGYRLVEPLYLDWGNEAESDSTASTQRKGALETDGYAS
jgi:hypothetical protein